MPAKFHGETNTTCLSYFIKNNIICCLLYLTKTYTPFVVHIFYAHTMCLPHVAENYKFPACRHLIEMSDFIFWTSIVPNKIPYFMWWHILLMYSLPNTSHLIMLQFLLRRCYITSYPFQSNSDSHPLVLKTYLTDLCSSVSPNYFS